MSESFMGPEREDLAVRKIPKAELIDDFTAEYHLLTDAGDNEIVAGENLMPVPYGQPDLRFKVLFRNTQGNTTWDGDITSCVQDRFGVFTITTTEVDEVNRLYCEITFPTWIGLQNLIFEPAPMDYHIVIYKGVNVLLETIVSRTGGIVKFNFEGIEHSDDDLSIKISPHYDTLDIIGINFAEAVDTYAGLLAQWPIFFTADFNQDYQNLILSGLTSLLTQLMWNSSMMDAFKSSLVNLPIIKRLASSFGIAVGQFVTQLVQLLIVAAVYYRAPIQKLFTQEGFSDFISRIIEKYSKGLVLNSLIIGLLGNFGLTGVVSSFYGAILMDVLDDAVVQVEP